LALEARKCKADNCRYLLINYRLADLIQRVSTADRNGVLQQARDAYERYLSLLDHYEILSTADKKLYRQYTESPTTFSTISTTDPNARRGAKIANFKLEKDLKKKLDVGIELINPRGTQLTIPVPSTKPSISSK
jgi:hypothetical protein